MRKLTLTRKRSFVASIMKIYIYIQTDEQPELVLQGVPLKLVTTMKNGETSEFEIPNEAVNLFVVFDKHIPNSFHTRTIINPGEAPVVLYTKPKLNPFRGNPFIIYE
ncbi:MAG: hypothetical protein JXB08_02275 [Bacilli bacterium]|nr:hypothetical protein [Bacilli bacterium]MBN2876187.1 hypothetical protein [Bacilli bacterium]